MSGTDSKKSRYSRLTNSFSRNSGKSEDVGNESSSIAMEEGKLTSKKSENDVTKMKKGMNFFQLMRVLQPYFWPNAGSDGALINRVRSTLTWVLVAASKTCNLLAPFYLSSATNFLIEKNWGGAVVNIVAFCGFRLASQVFSNLQGIVYIKVKQQASIELQTLTFHHLHELSLNWHLSKKTGSIVKSMDRGTDAVNNLVTYLFLFLIPALAECLAVVILFFAEYKQWGLGLIVFGGICLYIYMTITITMWRKKFREQTNKHDNDFHDKATDSIINFETVKYFTAEKFELDRYREAVIKYQVVNSSFMYALNILNISQATILQIVLVGAMLISARAVYDGDMSIGGWIAVQSWVANVFVPLNFLGGIYSGIVQALVDVTNLSELLSESPDIVDLPEAVSMPASKVEGVTAGASVAFDHVSFHYPEQPVEKGLKDVTFTVEPGTTTAIVGGTGAGKTTISRMLFRFYDPLQGAVKVNGVDIRQYTQKSVRDAIGVVPQDTVLFNDTILYNVKYGNRDSSMEDVIQAAEAAQILTFIESLPEKWNTMVGERGLKLSGGEKQRVAIARCLLKNPPIVLLDEATSALDTVTEYSVQEALTTLGRNRTVIVIAHRLSTIRHANQIVVLDNGIVVETGSHDVLLTIENGYYSKLWNMQKRSPEEQDNIELVEGMHSSEVVITSGETSL